MAWRSRGQRWLRVVRARARWVVLCGHVGRKARVSRLGGSVGWLQVQEQSKQAVEVAANRGNKARNTVTRRRPSAGYAAQLL
jgi:hypothetical protein